MGYYVEVPGFKGKAAKIEAIYGAERVTQATAENLIHCSDKAIICVVANENFEAAAFCYSPEEFDRFTHPADPRPKTWLVVDDRDTIARVTGYTADSVA
jgi:hypothetical protein